MAMLSRKMERSLALPNSEGNQYSTNLFVLDIGDSTKPNEERGHVGITFSRT